MGSEMCIRDRLGYLSQKGFLTILVFGKFICLVVERSLEEGFYFEGVIFFSQRQDHSFAFLVADHQRDVLVVGKYSFYLAEDLEVCNELVDCIKYLHVVLIIGSLILLVPLLESHHDQIIISELSDDLLISFNRVSPDFLARTIFIQIFIISLEGDNDMSIFHDFHQFDLTLYYPFLFVHVFNPEEILLIGVV